VKTRFLLVAAGALLAASSGPALAQCAMCKAALVSSEEGRALGPAVNQAILVMLAAPYLTFGSIAAFLLRGRIKGLLAPLCTRRR
jgi:hypothetical protein